MITEFQEDYMAPIAAILMVVGMLAMLAFIPISIYMQGRFIIALPLALDRKMGAIDALKESFQATREDHWMLMLHVFLSAMISQIGIYACYIGILASAPYGAGLLGAAQAQLLGEIPPDDLNNPGNPAGQTQSSATGIGDRSQGFVGQAPETDSSNQSTDFSEGQGSVSDSRFSNDDEDRFGTRNQPPNPYD